MQQNYEIYLILHPELSAEEINGELNNLKSVLENELKASDVDFKEEGLRKLAYQIGKNATGYYVLCNFNVALGAGKNIKNVERKLNLNEKVLRYLVLNQTEFLKQVEKQGEISSEVKNHRELNKGRADKRCVVKHVGLRVIDYKDTEFLSQFVSPYSKIFHRQKTGTSAKYQRKVTQAIKRARHMALLSFTPQT